MYDLNAVTRADMLIGNRRQTNGVKTSRRIRAAEPAVAYVNNGRWVADCPDCNSALDLAEGQDRFICGECDNTLLDGWARKLVWPERQPEIEAALSARKLTANRNWWPWETVDDLTAENALHKVGG